MRVLFRGESSINTKKTLKNFGSGDMVDSEWSANRPRDFVLFGFGSHLAVLRILTPGSVLTDQVWYQEVNQG